MTKKTMNAAEDRHPIELKSNAEEIKKLGMSNMKSSYKIHLFSGFDMGKKLLFLPSVTYSFSENSRKQGRENLVGKSGGRGLRSWVFNMVSGLLVEDKCDDDQKQKQQEKGWREPCTN